MIAATAFLSTLIDLCFGSERGWHDILEGGTWQSACWSAVSLAAWPFAICPDAGEVWVKICVTILAYEFNESTPQKASGLCWISVFDPYLPCWIGTLF